MGNEKITIEKNFPSRLRQLIEQRCGGKQAKFIKTTGISQSYLSMVLSGKRGPSAELIAALAVHFGDNVVWLITGQERGEGQGGAGRIDQERLLSAIATIEKAIQHSAHKLTPAKRAQLTLALYELPGSAEDWDGKLVNRLLSLAQ
jgi:transcriptional regulator with XRE-family HTH domain